MILYSSLYNPKPRYNALKLKETPKFCFLRDTVHSPQTELLVLKLNGYLLRDPISTWTASQDL